MNLDHRFSRPLEAPRIRALSLGAGVQSTTLALMGSRGDLERPDFAIFADTGKEPRRIYEHLDWLDSVLTYPLVRVRRPGLSLHEMAIEVAAGRMPYQGAALPPWFTKNPDGMLRKQCSKEFKVRPVEHWLRDQLGVAPGKRGPAEPVVELWIGISRDEIDRMGRSERKWIHHRHPLIEMGMTRLDCRRWLSERQYRASKSSCIFCPYRDMPAWRAMKANDPEDFEDACQIDEAIRAGFPGMVGEAYVHRQLVPLRDIDTSDAQMELELSDEAYECEGHCMT